MSQDFYNKCYEIVREVPAGKIITYKTIANMLNTKAYRAVGTAMKNNPCSWISGDPKFRVPCHRVIPSNGRVGGFNDGTEEKIRLLQEEGIKIEINNEKLEDSKIKNFKEVALVFD